MKHKNAAPTGVAQEYSTKSVEPQQNKLEVAEQTPEVVEQPKEVVVEVADDAEKPKRKKKTSETSTEDAVESNSESPAE